jgi:hypothetical protein
MIAGSPQFASLALAYRAEEGRTPGLGDPLDDPATAEPQTRQSFAIVNLEDMLKIPEFPIGLSMIT